MNQQIVNYLVSNKDKFPQAVLTNVLIKAGHNVNEINEAVAIVFGQAALDKGAVAPFYIWDFKTRIVYSSSNQKRKDFWLGFGAEVLPKMVFSWLPILGYVLIGKGQLLSESMWLIILGWPGRIIGLVLLIAIFYLFNRRRYVSYGIIAGKVVGFIVGLGIGALLLFSIMHSPL